MFELKDASPPTNSRWLRDVSLMTVILELKDASPLTNSFWLSDVSFITIKLPFNEESPTINNLWLPVTSRVTSKFAFTFVLPPTMVFPMFTSFTVVGNTLNVSLFDKI